MRKEDFILTDEPIFKPPKLKPIAFPAWKQVANLTKILPEIPFRKKFKGAKFGKPQKIEKSAAILSKLI